MMDVIFCDNASHPVNNFIKTWILDNNLDEKFSLNNNLEKISGGNILFLVSCSTYIDSFVRSKFNKVLVLHASDLPLGRGWSPHVWSIINGESEIIVTLLDADEEIDSGCIWKKQKITVEKTDLFHEISNKLFQTQCELMLWARKNIYKVSPKPQVGVPTYFPKRSPVDSRIDINAKLSDVINIIRVSDPVRYPAYLIINGEKIYITLSKDGSLEEH